LINQDYLDTGPYSQFTNAAPADVVATALTGKIPVIVRFDILPAAA
jgi:hypothetical protein